MDEPCSALDPIATTRIEDLMRELSEDLSIVIVTHNMQQAARVSDRTAFFTLGERGTGVLVEFDETQRIFTTPSDDRTEAYITGRFGSEERWLMIPRAGYDQQLKHVQEELLLIGSMVEKTIQRSIESLSNRDLVLAKHIVCLLYTSDAADE